MYGDDDGDAYGSTLGANMVSEVVSGIALDIYAENGIFFVLT